MVYVFIKNLIMINALWALCKVSNTYTPSKKGCSDKVFWHKNKIIRFNFDVLSWFQIHRFKIKSTNIANYFQHCLINVKVHDIMLLKKEGGNKQIFYFLFKVGLGFYRGENEKHSWLILFFYSIKRWAIHFIKKWKGRKCEFIFVFFLIFYDL
jgi:hypothetical protein